MKPRRGAPRGAAAAGSSNKAVIALGVMVGFVLLYGWNSVFLSPRSQERDEVKTQLATAKKKENDLRQNAAKLHALAADTQSREAELARLGRLVPADADLAGAILALDQTAKQAQVAWASLTPAAPVAGTGGTPATIGLTIQLGGTFNQIFDYLGRLETLDRLVVVDSLQLSPSSGGGGGSPPLTVNVRARMFAAGGPAAPGTTASSPSSSTVGTTDVAALPKAGG